LVARVFNRQAFGRSMIRSRHSKSVSVCGGVSDASLMRVRRTQGRALRGRVVQGRGPI
jgi:hypothetical protein